MYNIKFSHLIALPTIVIFLSSCGSSSPTPSSTLPESGNTTTNTTAADNTNKYNAQSYSNRAVFNPDLHGLWIMAGTENISITDTNTGESASGIGQRREIFAIKRTSNIAELSMRSCGSSQWYTVNTAIGNLPTFNIASTQFDPVSSNQIDITRTLNLNDVDTVSSLSGTYTAFKISDNADLIPGSLTLTALITDFMSSSLNQIFIANNEAFNIYCFAEFESPVATGIPGFTKSHTMEVYYEDSNPAIDENSLFLTSIFTTDQNNTNSTSYVTSIEHGLNSFNAIGDEGVIKLNYNNDDESSINIDFDAYTPEFNNKKDNATGIISIDL